MNDISNQASSKKDSSLSGFIAFLVIAIVIIGLVSWGFERALTKYVTDPQERGLFGDMFGALNTAFSGLAFAGVIYAIILQRTELGYQREELRRSAEAQDATQKALNEQVRMMQETAKLTVAAMQPEVIVYVAADEARGQFLLLIIENIGKGVAKNIAFTPSKPIAIINRPPSKGPLATGIPFLAPGGKRVFIWGRYDDLLKQLHDSVITVTVSFENAAGAPLPEQHCPIEVLSFDATDAVDHDGARLSARELKRIADKLDQR